MADCDITNGRFINDCRAKRAGVKTVFFFRHYHVGRVNRNAAGEIIYFGNGLIFRFEQDDGHGQATQDVVNGGQGTQHVEFKIGLTSFYVTPEFSDILNVIKQGKWAIFYLDYENNIRMMGEQTPMYEVGSVDNSGPGPGDMKYFEMEFIGTGQDFAPYLAPFTEYPFDNFPVLVVPQYVPTFKKLLINNTDRLSINNFGDKLSYG